MFGSGFYNLYSLVWHSSLEEEMADCFILSVFLLLSCG